MEQKHYIDIENARFESDELREKNTMLFQVGDHVNISEKIDGCLHGDTPILLADGTTEKIRNIVDKKLDVLVVTYNFDLHKFENSKILNYYNHGIQKPFIKISYRNPKQHASNDASIFCTPDHKFWNEEKYVEAQELRPGDKLYTITTRFTEIQKQLVLGTLLGDSCVYPLYKNQTDNVNRNYGIVFSHSLKQEEYAKFKFKVLDSFASNTEFYTSGYGSQCIRCFSRTEPQITSIIKLCFDENRQKRISKEWLKQLDYMGLAFWYMDDGSLEVGNNQSPRVRLHVEAYSEEEVDTIIEVLKEKFNLDASKHYYKKYWYIMLNWLSSERFFYSVYPYVVDSMRYKLPKKYRNHNTFWDTVLDETRTDTLFECEITKIDYNPVNWTSKSNYDIETQNHNYFANGILVHNSNAMATYDVETDSMLAFSRKKPLDFQNTLNGFWNYVQALDSTQFKLHPNWRIFGEWCNKRNRLIYDERAMGKWIVYSIWDALSERWLDQILVKNFCKDAGLEYVHVFYDGPFISWEHVRSFLHSPQYGENQEGCVIRNLDKLNNPDDHTPFILKIVNEEFKETMKPRIRETDAERESKKSEAQILAESIITRNRVEKELYKMRDDGEVPEKISPKDMGLVARILPKRIYDDCMKEEKETVMACGEFFGKMCSSLSMRHARDILL